MNTFANKKPSTASKNKKRSLKHVITRWHRRIGIFSAIVIIYLAISGISLNHITTLFQPQSYVSSSWLLDWYNISPPAVIQGYQLSSSEPANFPSDVIWADGTLLIQEKSVLFNQQTMLGLKAHQDIMYIFTQNALHLYTMDGQKVESTTLEHGLYTQFYQLLSTDTEQLVGLKSEGGEVHLYNLDDMAFIEHGSNEEPAFRDNLNTPLLATDADRRFARRHILLKTKVLEDIHSGRFFGIAGPWVIDAFALAFLFLASSGIYVWLKGGSKKN